MIAGRIVTILDADNTRYNQKINQSIRDLGKLDDSSKKVGVSLSSMFKGAIAIGATLAIGSLLKDSISLASEMEDLSISIKTMVGSAQDGDILIQLIRQMASETPFVTKELINASKSLIAFGVDSKSVVPTLKTLGDVSAGTGKDIKELSIIYGQIRSAGRLMGQDLMQLINAGFNPLQVISEKTGRSVRELKEDMSKGLITFDMVEQAFKDATAEGGMFFNMMENKSKTFSGRLSTFRDSLDNLKIKAGETLLGPLTKAVELATDALELLIRVNKTTGKTELTTAGKVALGTAGAGAAVGGTAGIIYLLDTIKNLAITTAALRYLGNLKIVQEFLKWLSTLKMLNFTSFEAILLSIKNTLPLVGKTILEFFSKTLPEVFKKAMPTLGPLIISYIVGSFSSKLIDKYWYKKETEALKTGIKAPEVSELLQVRREFTKMFGEEAQKKAKKSYLESIKPDMTLKELEDFNLKLGGHGLEKGMRNPFDTEEVKIKILNPEEFNRLINTDFEKLDTFKQELAEQLYDEAINKLVEKMKFDELTKETNERIGEILAENEKIQNRQTDNLSGAFSEGSAEAYRIINQLSTKGPDEQIAKNTKEIERLIKILEAEGIKLQDTGIATP